MKIQGGKFLSFLLGKEVHGIPIGQAKEIIGMMEMTYIPKVQGYIKGVINLRGKIIPVIDARLRFGMQAKPYTERTCIIVAEVDDGERNRLVGIVVDAVAEVLNIQAGEIEPPHHEARAGGEFIAGFGKIKDKVILILDLGKVLPTEEISYAKAGRGTQAIGSDDVDPLEKAPERS